MHLNQCTNMKHRLYLYIFGLFSIITLQSFTIVIDAGHGGKDSGALGQTTKEKDVNLGVALKLGKMIERNCDDVKVVYTRKNDTFISLQERAETANKASGDLFLSIHSNSASEKSKTRLSASGTSVYVLGRKSEENLAVAKRENSVMMLEDDYSTKYSNFDPNSIESYIAFELIQNQHLEHSLLAADKIQTELVESAGRKDNGVRQAMFWVLVKTGMPSVLIELDFICNPKHDRYLGSDAGQTQLAEAIFNGFMAYKSAYDKELSILNGKESTPKSLKPETKLIENTIPATEIKAENDKPVFKIQFMTSSKQLSPYSGQMKGLKDIGYYLDGAIYKYTTGEWDSMDKAQNNLSGVRKLFPDAFIIKMCNGKRIK